MKPVYAYAPPGGTINYQLPGSQKQIGQFTAFLYGLPSVWNEVLFYTLMVLIPLVFFGPLLVALHKRRYGRLDSLDSPDLKLWHRMLCVLLSYIFLIGPEAFHALSQAAIQYSQLSTASWGSGNRTIEYEYDTNGSLTQKTTSQTLPAETLEVVDYVYNLQNRLASVTTTAYSGGSPSGSTTTEYTYNTEGIRLQKVVDDTYLTDYLIDPLNDTGYAQVLQETEYDITIPANPVPLGRTDYAIGDDVISQTKSTWSGSAWSPAPTQYFLYDGHGSTRQLVNSNLSIQDSYSYDGYGIMLSDGSGAQAASTAAQNDTSLLYCGEQYDQSSDHYYLRARYYNPANGMFNRMDGYSGNLHDPQSLHKYLYCHANPTNGIDPDGLFFTLVGTILSIAIRAITYVSYGIKILKIGMNMANLKELGEYVQELYRTPIPDLIDKIELQKMTGIIAIDILGETFDIALSLLKAYVEMFAFSLLFRATLGFLREAKNSIAFSRYIRSLGPVQDPSRVMPMLPLPKMEKHHIFPQSPKFTKFWRKARIDIHKYTVEIERNTHSKGIHGQGLMNLPGRWNARWQKFFDGYKGKYPSAKEIYQFAGKMMDEYGLSGLKIVPYF